MDKRSKKALQGMVNPFRIYLTAQGYHKAADVLLAEIDAQSTKITDAGGGSMDTSIFLPQMMITAFAVELYLKCIFGIENGSKTTSGHKLNTLYGRLSGKSQKLLKDLWDADDKRVGIGFSQGIEGLPNKARSLEDSLKKSDEAFVDIRYHYEKSIPPDFVLHGLPKSLNEAVLTMQPNWANKPMKGTLFRAIPPSAA